MFAKVKERIDTGVKAAGAVVGNSGTAAGGDRQVPSIIGPDMRVSGNLDTPGEVHVEGRIDGDVTCSKLIVGAKGIIYGRISAASVRVHGTIQGAIDAEEVYLLSGSTVDGDILQATLEIAHGARFEGAVRRRRSGDRVPLQAPTAAEPPVVVAVERLEDKTTPAEPPPLPAADAPADAEEAPLVLVDAEVVEGQASAEDTAKAGSQKARDGVQKQRAAG